MSVIKDNHCGVHEHEMPILIEYFHLYFVHKSKVIGVCKLLFDSCLGEMIESVSQSGEVIGS